MMSRRALKGLFATAVTAVAATTTGLALADESRPSVQVEYCSAGEWDVRVMGVNQRGDDSADYFSGKDCTIFAKGRTPYWWAIGSAVQVERFDRDRREFEGLLLPYKVPEHLSDGQIFQITERTG